MFPLVNPPNQCSQRKKAIISKLKSHELPMFTLLSWEELPAQISFTHFIMQAGNHESGTDIFSCFYSIYQFANAFVLSNIHCGQQHKKPLLDFRLELAKQLIDGFSQRKRKRRSLDAVNQTAVDPGQHISVHVEGRKRKCVQCIKAGRRAPKGYKVERHFECKLDL